MAAAALDYDVLAPVHEPTTRDQALAQLRRTDPIRWDEENGWWLCTRHADVRHISRHPLQVDVGHRLPPQSLA